MHSLKDKFDEVCLRLGQDRRLESTGSDPIYYLVFPVSEMLTVKRQTRAWVAKLENQGWHVVTFSMAKTINSILRGHKLRKQWLIGEKMALSQAERAGKPIEFGDINKTLAKALTEGTELLQLLKSTMEEAASYPDGLLLITDLEALHPYLRINSIEAQLQGHIRCPILVLYPGKREGKTSLRFLEFYPADPNYRSEHIG
ncbi:MAG: BREX protein BrxB domain-containing protein [Candidatus Binatia bacterium]